MLSESKSLAGACDAAPPTKLGLAMGILSTSRTFAGTIGIALIGLFLNAMQAKYSSEGAHDATIASFSTTHYALAVCLIITFALSFFLHHRKSTHNLPPSSAEGWD